MPVTKHDNQDSGAITLNADDATDVCIDIQLNGVSKAQVLGNGTMSVGAGGTATAFTSYRTGTTAAATDFCFFIAPRAMKVISIVQLHAVAAGGASKLQVTKDTGTDAPGAGTNLLTNNTNAGFDLNATANTLQTGTLATTAGLTTLAAGDRLSVDFADAIQSSAGVVVTVGMQPV